MSEKKTSRGTMVRVIHAIDAVDRDWVEGASVAVAKGGQTLVIFARGSTATELEKWLKESWLLDPAVGIQDANKRLRKLKQRRARHEREKAKAS